MSRTTRILSISFPRDEEGYHTGVVTATVSIEIDRHNSRDQSGRWVGRYSSITCHELHSDAVHDVQALGWASDMAFGLRNGDTIAGMTDVQAICQREYDRWADLSQRALPLKRSNEWEPSIAVQAEHRIAA